MLLGGGLWGVISHTQPLSYGNTIHLPLPTRDLIHFATTETALMMVVVDDTTAVPMKTTGLQQNLKLVLVLLKNFLSCFNGFS